MKHIVAINSSEMTVNDGQNIPTGEIIDITSSPNDFQIPIPLSKSFRNRPIGFDNYFCLDRCVPKKKKKFYLKYYAIFAICRMVHELDECQFVAQAHHPPSGRVLEVYSNQPGVQFNTANNLPSLDASIAKKQSMHRECEVHDSKKEGQKVSEQNIIVGKGKKLYKQFGGFSLQTQKYPDAVNHVR